MIYSTINEILEKRGNKDFRTGGMAVALVELLVELLVLVIDIGVGFLNKLC